MRTRTKLKVTDTGAIPAGSRADQTAKTSEFYKLLRLPAPPAHVLELGRKDPAEIIKHYKLIGFEFGRWVNFNDRLDYLITSTTALYDLNRILKFNNNLGFDLLSIAIGARGSGWGAAHFEAGNNAINLNRFHRPNRIVSKEKRIELTGGISSLGHEYGHFLDYFFGGYIDQNKANRALSLGDSSHTTPPAQTAGALRGQMDKVINAIIWKKPGEHTDYYNLLKKQTAKKSDYWTRRNELFARAFEVYLYEQLKALGQENKALTHGATRYNDWPYIQKTERPAVNKQIDILVKLMQQVVVDGVAVESLKLPKVKPAGPTSKPAKVKKLLISEKEYLSFDTRGYSYAIVKDSNIITSGSNPVKARDKMPISYWLKQAKQYNAKLYIAPTDKQELFKINNDNLILGYTWEQIQDMQQGRKVDNIIKTKMPDNAVEYPPYEQIKALAPKPAPQQKTLFN